MKRGVVLFAHNNENTDYYRMAKYTAARVNQFLNLPVTVITDSDSSEPNHPFDNQIIISPDRDNYRKKTSWVNRGRYQVGELSPYDETLVIDTDYLINSDKLLQVWDMNSDFVCFRQCRYLLDDTPPECLGIYQLPIMWATVFRFRKTHRTRQIFSMMQMIQENYNHYSNIYQFHQYTYRNDYALTIALRTVGGQLENSADYFPHKLWHIPPNAQITRLDDVSYEVSKDNQRIHISDVDVHVMNKNNFMELVECATVA